MIVFAYANAGLHVGRLRRLATRDPRVARGAPRRGLAPRPPSALPKFGIACRPLCVDSPRAIPALHAGPLAAGSRRGLLPRCLSLASRVGRFASTPPAPVL